MPQYIYHFDNHFVYNPKPCDRILLYQLGEMFCNENTVIAEHDQLCFEITYATAGKGQSFANGIPSTIQENDCFISFPGDKHCIVSDSGKPLHYCFLSVGTYSDEDVLFILQDLKKNFSDEKTRVVNHPNLSSFFHNLFKEIRAEDSYSNLLLGLNIKQMLIEIYRSFKNIRIHDYSPNFNTSSALVSEIANYIDNNVFEIKNLNELEKVFNYNYQYLSRTFISIMGISLNSYFLRNKMKTAAELLKSGESITGVSEKLNYSSIHVFSRAFKSFYGYSPRAYKNIPDFTERPTSVK